MKHLLPTMLFFSAHRSDRSPEQNLAAHNTLSQDLTNVHRAFIGTVGCYAGVLEQSVGLVVSQTGIHSWVEYAARLGQESVLVRYPDGSCYLIFCADQSEAYVGQWTEVSAAKAMGSVAWTRLNGKWYIAQ